uniref:Putative transcriptional regulatory protein NedR n=1 Tax=Micromonospora viridifaciens TaxID=1881 RepID=NEDR_MICVI|nr:RecName: Full=Putative transcriptional regulatory protein NedR [Micromonospora viridifaciens]BAA00851.1 nedR protein [Micromonospora viridifaciens]
MCWGRSWTFGRSSSKGWRPTSSASSYDEHRADLSTLADEMVDLASQGRDGLEVDRAFHLKLMEPLGNDLILQLTEAFWQVQAIVAPTLRTEPEDRLITAQRHRAIVDAATAGDPEALRSAIADHYAPIRTSIARAVQS